VNKISSFYDGMDDLLTTQSYCIYSAFGETGNDPVEDPTYPDPLPDGWNHSLQCGVYAPTNVMSVSYSSQEFDHPEYYQKRMCNE